jgi:mannosyl-oligosaccharide alpha-1,2-mannosidase
MIVCYFFIFQVITQSFLTSNRKRDSMIVLASYSTGKFLFLILIFGVAYLMLTNDTIPSRVVSRDQVFGIRKNEENNSSTHEGTLQMRVDDTFGLKIKFTFVL